MIDCLDNGTNKRSFDVVSSWKPWKFLGALLRLRDCFYLLGSLGSGSRRCLASATGKSISIYTLYLQLGNLPFLSSSSGVPFLCLLFFSPLPVFLFFSDDSQHSCCVNTSPRHGARALPLPLPPTLSQAISFNFRTYFVCAQGGVNSSRRRSADSSAPGFPCTS